MSSLGGLSRGWPCAKFATDKRCNSSRQPTETSNCRRRTVSLQQQPPPRLMWNATAARSRLPRHGRRLRWAPSSGSKRAASESQSMGEGHEAAGLQGASSHSHLNEVVFCGTPSSPLLTLSPVASRATTTGTSAAAAATSAACDGRIRGAEWKRISAETFMVWEHSCVLRGSRLLLALPRGSDGACLHSARQPVTMTASTGMLANPSGALSSSTSPSSSLSLSSSLPLSSSCRPRHAGRNLVSQEIRSSSSASSPSTSSNSASYPSSSSSPSWPPSSPVRRAASSTAASSLSALQMDSSSSSSTMQQFGLSNSFGMVATELLSVIHSPERLLVESAASQAATAGLSACAALQELHFALPRKARSSSQPQRAEPAVSSRSSSPWGKRSRSSREQPWSVSQAEPAVVASATATDTAAEPSSRAALLEEKEPAVPDYSGLATPQISSRSAHFSSPLPQIPPRLDKPLEEALRQSPPPLSEATGNSRGEVSGSEAPECFSDSAKPSAGHQGGGFGKQPDLEIEKRRQRGSWRSYKTPRGAPLRSKTLAPIPESNATTLEKIHARHVEFYDKLERQRETEMDAHRRAAVEYKALLLEMGSKGLGANFAPGKALMVTWFLPLKQAIESKLAQLKKKETLPEELAYAGLIMNLDPEILAVLVAHKIVELLLAEHGRHGLSSSRGSMDIYFPRSLSGHHSFVKMVTAATAVGRAVEMEVKVQAEIDRVKKAKEKIKKTAEGKSKVQIAAWQKGGVASSHTPTFPPSSLPAASSLSSSGSLPSSDASPASADESLQSSRSIMRKWGGKVPSKDEAKRRFNRSRAAAGARAQEEESWDSKTVVQVGTMLIQLLMETAMVPSTIGKQATKKLEKKLVDTYGKEGAILVAESDRVAERGTGGAEQKAEWSQEGGEERTFAILHDYAYIQKNRKYGCVCCTPEVRAIIDEAAERDFVPNMPYMPMVIKPRRWKGHNKGAFLCLPSSVMRTHGAREQRLALKQHGEHMKPVYKALDVLGRTAWRVNKPVASVLQQLWDEGGNVGGLVNQKKEVNGLLPKEEASRLKEANVEEYKAYLKKRRKIEKLNAERHSLTADMNLKLQVVKQCWDEDSFYYPHNLDFRGRAYPMHPHFHHLGADASRGMLEFAHARPLGPRGLWWLQVQLANLWGDGVDKRPLEQRADYAREHLADIYDSAERPLEGERWWLNAEDPFQCLAVCIDIRNAIESGDPPSYLSRLPVHQDGSCNGLQHYAALGRDTEGARQVNLTDGERPADVYTGIAKKVEQIIRADALNPHADRHREAKLLVDYVDRKLVKQTVMTSVYGVTFIGARGQIHNRIKEKGFVEDDDVAYAVACYAAKVTLEALSQMFSSARKIMSWLAECARLIAQQGKTVEWVTPMGLPVVQPYRKPSSKAVKTTLQSINVSDSNDGKVSVSRQRSAFPPNFVHSLDSSHMMRTALACDEAGLAFAGVHDSFWTHAGSVDAMNAILRQEFVALHSEPILENLLASFQERHPEITFPPVPERGDFDIQSVLGARYFFS
eukprot:TRINITY_DN1202_c0_g1_i1.p1 TRINITY_DN1202_c0_g1~~TRINITY_DN1202_c0_g1_i1.p1  ORF type:complete len:1526 (+),score=314.63 TRINITY_DN1202_c0_g1_i1:354-4931(+)